MDEVINVENLGKKYIISHQGSANDTFREVITENAKKIFKNNLFKKSTKEEFWALKNVSFSLNNGERLGIIGRNGAGKSTLLKLLSRITEPTEGRIKIKGKIASLLEVGTGFHPELTGRENIYLNGAVLGMSRSEIKRKFDDIVEFSGVEQFLDTPVKRYSSGMYVRLAFAVAAHLESEILLVDEVLAVGDVQFQKKCLDKMGEISSQEGRTVIFVSHNMNAIQQLCNRCLLIEKGNLIMDCYDVREVTNRYLYDGRMHGDVVSEWINIDNEYENLWIKPIRFFISDFNGNKLSMPINNSEDIWLNIIVEIKTFDLALQIGYAIFDEENNLIYVSNHTDTEESKWNNLKEGIYNFKSKISKRFLNEGKYKLQLISSLYCRFWIYEPGTKAPSISFEIQGGLSNSSYWMQKRHGILAPNIDWEIIEIK